MNIQLISMPSRGHTPSRTLKRMASTAAIIAMTLVSSVACTQAGGQATAQPTQPPAAPTTQAPPAATATSVQPTPATNIPAGWQTHRNETHGYSISYPAELELQPNGDLSVTIGNPTGEPAVGPASFIYMSAIPKGFEGSAGDIYNYDPAQAERLLNMQVGDSKSLSEGNPDLDRFFTYMREPDTQIAGNSALTYTNPDPWEFPPEVKEVRYYLQTDAYTYLLGGYITESDPSAQAGFITEALFNQIIATFQVEATS
jgi:hypothetical protein